MEHREVPIDLLVNAVLDGRAVDWDSAESTASSEDQRAQIRHFRTLATIATLHRESEGARTETPVPAKAEVWGPLRLLERIGEGSFGDVYRAWDTKLAREVALKLLRHRGSTVDWSEDRALEEGRLLARIRHPNVVTVFGADRIGDRVGIWMEFIRGRTLQDVLRAHGALSAREATAIGLDLCLALSAVHRAGLLHRDIKSQNVMREDGGRIVLMDFGAGREDVDAGPAELAGTPLYLAPEVFAGAPATTRSDIYSLGVLLYHLATGSYPVKGRTAAELRAAHGSRQRTWLRDERPDLPDKFVQAVERALEADADVRYESVGAMEAALARAVSASDSAAPTPMPGTPPSAPPVVDVTFEPSRRRAWVVAAAFAGAAIVAGVFTTPLWRDRELGWRGSSPAGGKGPRAAADSSVVARKVTLPDDYTFIGRPSADGKLFSLVDGTGNLALIDLATGQLRRVTTDAVFGNDSQYAEHSAISSDSRFVAYGWFALDGKYELRLADVNGRRPRVLLRSETVDYPWPVEWSRDGRFIVTILTHSDYSNELALISTADGAVRTVKELGAVRPEHASLSPDGEFIVYDYPQQPSATAHDIFIIRSDGSDERRLIDAAATDIDPVWTPDGRRVLFASDRSGAVDLWSIAIDRGFAKGEPLVVHRNIGRMWLRGLTDGGSYYYHLTVGAVDVYTAQLAGNAVSNPVAVPTSYTGSNISSLFSPEGHSLAYASRRGLVAGRRGWTTLAIRDLQTNAQREFVPPLNGFLLRAWSPDGRHILVGGQDVQGRQGRYQIDVDTGRTSPILVTGRPSDAPDFRRPDWTADGRILYFSEPRRTFVRRDVESGAEQVVESVEQDVTVTADIYGRGYRLSPDGQMLAYTSSVHEGDIVTRSIWIKGLQGGPPRELVRVAAPEAIVFQDWTPDGIAVVFTRRTVQPNQPLSPPSLWRVSIYGGEPQSLGLIMDGLRDVSVHPDGSRITFTAGWPKTELWVLENFLGGR